VPEAQARAAWIHRVAAACVATGLGVALAVSVGEAQAPVRIVGAVQWVAGARMQLMTDTGASLAVDLTEADQSSYQGLRGGEAVVVDGVVSPDRRRVMAREIWRDSGRGYWTQSP
jgi:hypothetical protein